MEERSRRNGSQRVTSDQNLCNHSNAMCSVQNKMAAPHSVAPRTYSSLAWRGGFRVYQQGMATPYGVSLRANSVNPCIMRRAPSISGPSFHWHRNACGYSSFPAALNTTLPSVLKLPRMLSGHRNPALGPGISVVHEKKSLVERASLSSLLQEPARLDELPRAGPYNYRQWHHTVDNAYVHNETQQRTSYDVSPAQSSGGVDAGAQMFDATQTLAVSNGCYTSEEMSNDCLTKVTADFADGDGSATGPVENVCDSDSDDNYGEWDEVSKSCSDDEAETGDIGNGSDEKTREAVASLLTIMAKERRNRRWRRLANRRAAGRRPYGIGSMNETVRKLIGFTRMRCPYQESVRTCEAIQVPRGTNTNVKSVFWASDEYIKETTYAVKVLLEKY